VTRRWRSSTPRRCRSASWTSTTTASPTSACAGRTRSCCCRTAATASPRWRCPGSSAGRAPPCGPTATATARPHRCSPPPTALLLATPTGPRLYVNLGKGVFRDDTRRLPQEACYNLTAAAWGDFDGDGKPDILLANGFHGLRVYKNIRPEAAAKPIVPKFGDW